MTKHLFFVLLIVNSLLICAQNGADLFVGDTLYVWSINGLNMRESPNPTSRIIKKNGYKTPVVFQEKTEVGHVDEIAYWGLGKWAFKHPVEGKFFKVVNGNDTGYVFGPYLNQLVPFSIGEIPSLKEDSIVVNNVHIYTKKFDFSTEYIYGTELNKEIPFTLDNYYILLNNFLLEQENKIGIQKIGLNGYRVTYKRGYYSLHDEIRFRYENGKFYVTFEWTGC